MAFAVLFTIGNIVSLCRRARGARRAAPAARLRPG
jgi:hypothetical protein